jgi:hypothetical protein
MRVIAGVDEVGRGPLAGDVVAAAVILDARRPIEGLADSKKLTEKQRNRLFLDIQEKAAGFAIARATVAEIDRLNILHATGSCSGGRQSAAGVVLFQRSSGSGGCLSCCHQCRFHLGQGDS